MLGHAGPATDQEEGRQSRWRDLPARIRGRPASRRGRVRVAGRVRSGPPPSRAPARAEARAPREAVMPDPVAREPALACPVSAPSQSAGLLAGRDIPRSPTVRPSSMSGPIAVRDRSPFGYVEAYP